MNSKHISIVAVSLAVIAAGVAAIVVSANRSDEAKAYAEAEASAADKAAAEAKKAAKATEAEAEKRRAAEQSAKAAADELAAQKLAKETAELERKTAADNKATAEANAKAEQAKADQLRASRDEAKAKAEQAKAEQLKAREEATKAAAKADEEASLLAKEKLKADKILSEAKLLELRKIDFETLERELAAWKFDLEERERALQPEKTVADLSWAGGMEDTIIDAEGNVKKQEKKQYDPEKDQTLPVPSRKLAHVNRIVREKHAALADTTRSSVVASLEKLYVAALKDDRTVDAAFYKQSILSMYPDWKFKGEGEKEEKKEKKAEVEK